MWCGATGKRERVPTPARLNENQELVKRDIRPWLQLLIVPACNVEKKNRLLFTGNDHNGRKSIFFFVLAVEQEKNTWHYRRPINGKSPDKTKFGKVINRFNRLSWRLQYERWSGIRRK